MSQFVKMGEIPLAECQAIERMINQKDQIAMKCNLLQGKENEQYEQAKNELNEIEKELKKRCNQIMIDYKIEIIPGVNVRIDFENGDILAVLPEDGQEKCSEIR